LNYSNAIRSYRSYTIELEYKDSAREASRSNKASKSKQRLSKAVKAKACYVVQFK
jgi:hypothetical protein